MINRVRGDAPMRIDGVERRLRLTAGRVTIETTHAGSCP